MPSNQKPGLSTLEYHLLLAIVETPMHGYAIRDAVESESDGSLTPRAGTLYRVIARMMAQGFVLETDAPEEGVRHPGLERRYYALTPLGRQALANEAVRLSGVAALANARLRAI